ncbi:hypothetical protein [Caulobacter sp. Root343]|uniref:hypothetical protein n=1 Tax=Caulobacter sp. Root343 TaxID=1736520 RepID=UPI0006FA3661|nr:hypothetical protein [Caulobacter sp. Root343]KQV66611.1 hypothetical protein ASC70_12315 [Caulobacter sp. Root343]
MPHESKAPLSLPSSRQDLILEAMLTVGEIRKPGYVQKVMDQLLAQAASVVAELRPNAAPEQDSETRKDAVKWLRQASVRARARAEERHKRKRDTRKRHT